MKECPNCGISIEDDTLMVCPKCGTQLNPADETKDTIQNEGVPPETVSGPDFVQNEPTDPMDVIDASPVQENTQTPQKGINKKWLLIGVICAVVLIAIIVLLVCLLSSGSNKKAKNPYLNHGYSTTHRTSVFWLDDGGVMTVKGRADTSIMSRDKKHIIVLDVYGDLTLFDSNGENEKLLDRDVKSIAGVGNNFLYYSKSEEKETTVDDILNALVIDHGDTTIQIVRKAFEDNFTKGTVENAKLLYKLVIGHAYDETAYGNPEMYRYTYANEKVCKIGVYDNYIISENGENILFYKDDSLYLMKNTDEAAEKVSRITDNKIRLCNISDNNRLAAWIERDKKDNITLYCLDQGEKEKIGSYTNDDYTYLWSYLYNNGESIVFLDMTYDKIFIKHAGHEGYSVSLNGNPDLVNIFNENGTISQPSDKTSETIYLLCGEDYRDQSLYVLDKSGNRERLQDHVQQICSIKDGIIYYIDNDSSLYKAKISKNDLVDIEKITTEVSNAMLSASGKYMIIMKDRTNSFYSLYYTPTSDIELTKVAEDVSRGAITDNDTGVVYISNATTIKDADVLCGDLYYLDFNGKDEKEKISSDVINFTERTIFTKNNISYFKYDCVKDGDVLSSMMVYKNGDNQTLAEDVIYTKPY